MSGEGKVNDIDLRRAELAQNSAINQMRRQRDNERMKAERFRVRGYNTDGPLKNAEKLDQKLKELQSSKGKNDSLHALVDHLRKDVAQDMMKFRHLHKEMDVARRTEPGKARGNTSFKASPAGKKIANDYTKIGASLLERQVPAWYARHGVIYEQSRTNITADTNPPKPNKVELPRLEVSLDQNLTKFFDLKFENSADAKQSFLEMAVEAKKTAYWYVNNRPSTFGHVKGSAEKLKLYENSHTGSEMKLPEKWMKEANIKISECEASTNPKERHARHRAAGRLRALHADRLQLEKDLLPANDFLKDKTLAQSHESKGILERAFKFIKRRDDKTTNSPQQTTERHSSGMSARNKAPMTERQVKASLEAMRKSSIGLEKIINPFGIKRGR